MVAALDLGSSAERRVGSSPSVRTNKKTVLIDKLSLRGGFFGEMEQPICYAKD